jgi:hypothetical protein
MGTTCNSCSFNTHRKRKSTKNLELEENKDGDVVFVVVGLTVIVQVWL